MWHGDGFEIATAGESSFTKQEPFNVLEMIQPQQRIDRCRGGHGEPEVANGEKPMQPSNLDYVEAMYEELTS